MSTATATFIMTEPKMKKPYVMLLTVSLFIIIKKIKAIKVFQLSFRTMMPSALSREAVARMLRTGSHHLKPRS